MFGELESDKWGSQVVTNGVAGPGVVRRVRLQAQDGLASWTPAWCGVSACIDVLLVCDSGVSATSRLYPNVIAPMQMVVCMYAWISMFARTALLWLCQVGLVLWA
jgi:hypothetical protein